MTSANSFLDKIKAFFKEQRAITSRRLPLAALSVIVFFLYDVLGTALALQREKATGALYMDEILAAETWADRGAHMASNWMGFRGAVFFIATVGAILLGIQGFSYLYKSQTVDFFESRPEKRSSRFINIFVNSFLIYAVPSLVCAFLSWLLCVANGCAAGWVLSEIMLAWVFLTVMFLAVYGMSTLASLLTGTVVTAVLMNAFIFGIEALLRITIFLHRAAYYATFDEQGSGLLQSFITLPPYHYLRGVIELWNGNYESYNFEAVLSSLGGQAMGALANLLIFAAATAFAYIAFQKRKAEFAGCAVTYRPLMNFIKFSSGMLFSLCAGLFVYWIFGGPDRNAALPSIIITVLTTVFVGCAVLEAIFGLNIRQAFSRPWHMPVIAALALAILFIYRSDAFGYDRWLPDAEAVESAWLENYNYYGAYYHDDGNYMSTREYCEENMYITNIGDMITVAEISQQSQVRNVKGETDGSDYDYYAWGATIGWRLKNGKTVTRKVRIPENIDPLLMDRITGNAAFTNGVYQMMSYNDAAKIRDVRNPYAKLVMSLQTEHGYSEGDGSLYDGFVEAYKRDLEKHYNFSMASNNAPCGLVELQTSGNGVYFGLSLPLYEMYDQSIAYLDNAGLWKGGFISPEEVDHIALSYEFYDEDGEIWTSNSADISDIDGIRQVFDASISATYSSAWERQRELMNTGYDGSFGIAVYPKELPGNDGALMESHYPNTVDYAVIEDRDYDKDALLRQFITDDIPETARKLVK